MSKRRKFGLIGALLALIGAGLAWTISNNRPDCCGFAPDPPTEALGLMTSLPIYWPLGTDVVDLASGEVANPWQRTILERSFHLVPLDTLSPMKGLGSEDPDVDPLEGLTKLAIIQPRGLSPADNVALDDWVRSGGRLLIALDPALSLDYPIPFGDPRRPTATALVPPVIDRWGLAIAYEDHSYHGHAIDQNVSWEALDDGVLPVLLAGRVARAEDVDCISAAREVVARCKIGEGSVTVIADAAVFEHRLEDSVENRTSEAAIANLLNFAMFQ